MTLASIAGETAPIDPRSRKPVGKNDASVDRFLGDEAMAVSLASTIPMSEVDARIYDAVFLPGGHSTMWDLPESIVLAALPRRVWLEGKVIAAVYHGPVDLPNATDEAGEPPAEGRRVAAFSDSEERVVGLADAVLFLLESRLRELGGHYESVPDFQLFAIADGRLITGQNPASSTLTAKLSLQALGVYA